MPAQTVVWGPELIGAVRTRVRMYIGEFEGQSDAAGCYVSFLTAVLAQSRLGAPHVIELISCGEQHAAVAFGCRIPDAYGGSGNVGEWLYGVESYDADVHNGSVGMWLSPLAILSEFAFLEVTAQQEHLRQAYHQADPASPCERKTGEQLPVLAPYIGIQFMLASDLFPVRTLTLNRMRRALKEFKADHSDPRRRPGEYSGRTFLALLQRVKTTARQFGDDTFVLRLEWDRSQDTARRQ